MILQSILEELMSGIEYARFTLPECCAQAAEHFPSPYREGLSSVNTEMECNRGVAFGQVFLYCMGKALQQTALAEEDRAAFLSCFEKESPADSRLQLFTLRKGVETLSGIQKQLEEDRQEKSRVAVGLGALSGMFLIVLLL